MEKPWLKSDNLTVNLENIPGLLDRYNLLPNFLRKLLESKYTHGIAVKKDEQVLYFQNFLREKNINGVDQLNDWLKENGLDDKRLDTLLFEKLQLDKFKIKKFENQVENYFIESKPLLDKVIYSVLVLKDVNQANELFIQIEEKESSFADLVNEYSLGSEKNSNGIIGPIEFGKLDPVFRERLKSSKSGQLWPPFEFQNNWLILRHEKYLPCKLDKNMKSRIIKSLYEQWINNKVIDLLDQVRYKKKVSYNTKINDKNLPITNNDNLSK